MTEYKNDNITLTASQQTGCRTTFDIKVSPLGAKAAWANAVKKVKKEVSLPGFRKGKAPDHVIQTNYAKFIEREWRDILVESSFSDAVTLSNIVPVHSSRVERPELKSASMEEGAHVIIKFEARPTVPNIEVEGLTLKSIEEKSITDKDVEEVLEAVRLHHAEWEDAEDRALEEGDYALLDIENLEKPGMMITEGMRYHIKEKVTPDWIRKQIIGKKAGESFEAISEGEKIIPIRCKVSVIKVQVPKLAEINEDFLKKARVASVEELKTKIRHDLEVKEKERIKGELRSQVEEQLLEKYPFDIPFSLINFDVERRLKELKASFEGVGFDEQKSKEMIANREKELLGEVLAAYRLHFLYNVFASAHKLAVSEEEVFRQLISDLSSGALSMHEGVEEAKGEIRSQLLNKKVLDFIVDKIQK